MPGLAVFGQSAMICRHTMLNKVVQSYGICIYILVPELRIRTYLTLLSRLNLQTGYFSDKIHSVITCMACSLNDSALVAYSIGEPLLEV